MSPLPAREEQPHVVAVIGSPRRQGNAAALVGAALEELERCGCRCTAITLADLHINACDGHSNCGELPRCPHDDDTAGLLDAVYGADINPYAVAIARFRLTLAFLDKAGYARLADAPAVPLLSLIHI